MRMTRLAGAMVAGIMATALGTGSALAEGLAPSVSSEPSVGTSESLLAMEEFGLQPMEAEDLRDLSGGTVLQAAIVDQTQYSHDNDINIQGDGNIGTGAVDSSVNARGGISSSAVISGINNSVQISTTLNLYFNQAAPQTP